MRSLHLTSAALLVALLHAGDAAAQGNRPERPYRGLFGADLSQVAESMTVTTSTGGGWDSSIAGDSAANDQSSGLGTMQGASYSLASASAEYQNYGRRVQVGLSGTTTGRYYASFADPYLGAHAGMASIGLQLGRKTHAMFTQGLTYQPIGLLNPFPAAGGGLPAGNLQLAANPSFDLRALRQALTSTSSDARINQELTRRASLSFGYSQQRGTFGDQLGTFRSRSASGRFTYGLARGISLRLGYGYTNGSFALGGRLLMHQLDSGIDFAKSLSFSRRTLFGFDTGMTAFAGDIVTRYNVVGGAILVHEIGRTWALSGTYRRGVQAIPNLDRPLLTDAVTASLGGLLSRRVQVSGGGGAASGLLGIVGQDNGLWAYYASSGLNIALSRNLSLNTNYNYFLFDLDGSTYSALGFPDRLRRHGVSVSLSAWAPIIQKGRRINASR